MKSNILFEGDSETGRWDLSFDATKFDILRMLTAVADALKTFDDHETCDCTGCTAARAFVAFTDAELTDFRVRKTSKPN